MIKTPRPAMLTILLAAPALVFADASRDPRNIRNGFVIPDEGYCDQPYVVVTRDGNWLCTLTTGEGREGNRGQHVVATISSDQGRTWSPLIDIEPADGPEASWAMPLLTPDGRVYVFYDYNGDRIDWFRQHTNVRADMLGWYVYKYSDDNGRTWSPRRYRLPIRATEYDRENDYAGEVQMFWGIGKPIIVAGRVYLGFSKIVRYVVDQSEGWFLRCDNLLTERDPDRHQWHMLPRGDRGLRSPDGPIAEEQNLVALSDGTLYTMFRTVAGYPCHAYSHTQGASWSTPVYATYEPDGRRMETSRACPRIWRASNGKYLFWFHNHNGKDFDGRNPAWLSGGVEIDGCIHWSQPEIVLYDPDPAVRTSYPDLVQQDGRYWITETQKEIARVHEIDPALLEGLWSQWDNRTIAHEGLAASVDAPGPDPYDYSALAELHALKPDPGFTLEYWLALPEGLDESITIDCRDETGRGFVLGVGAGSRIHFEMTDGEHTGLLETIAPAPATGKMRHVVVIVDGGPHIISCVIDGQLCDGGESQQYGWSRFSSDLGVLRSDTFRKSRADGSGCVEKFRLYNRPLRTSEAVAHFRAGCK